MRSRGILPAVAIVAFIYAGPMHATESSFMGTILKGTFPLFRDIIALNSTVTESLPSTYIRKITLSSASVGFLGKARAVSCAYSALAEGKDFLPILEGLSLSRIKKGEPISFEEIFSRYEIGIHFDPGQVDLTFGQAQTNIREGLFELFSILPESDRKPDKLIGLYTATLIPLLLIPGWFNTHRINPSSDEIELLLLTAMTLDFLTNPEQYADETRAQMIRSLNSEVAAIVTTRNSLESVKYDFITIFENSIGSLETVLATNFSSLDSITLFNQRENIKKTVLLLAGFSKRLGFIDSLDIKAIKDNWYRFLTQGRLGLLGTQADPEISF